MLRASDFIAVSLHSCLTQMHEKQAELKQIEAGHVLSLYLTRMPFCTPTIMLIAQTMQHCRHTAAIVILSLFFLVCSQRTETQITRNAI